MYFGADLLPFMSIAAAGVLVSVLLGVTAGLSKYPFLVLPISMLMGFGPMLSNINPTLARFFRFAYTQQVNLGVGNLEANMGFNFLIIGINGIVAVMLFFWIHRNGKLQV